MIKLCFCDILIKLNSAICWCGGMADASDSKSDVREYMWVQVPPPAPICLILGVIWLKRPNNAFFLCFFECLIGLFEKNYSRYGSKYGSKLFIFFTIFCSYSLSNVGNSSDCCISWWFYNFAIVIDLFRIYLYTFCNLYVFTCNCIENTHFIAFLF